MIGDQADFQRRLRAVLPQGWFPDDSPILENVLDGLGTAWSVIYTFLSYAKSQCRIHSASSFWLDLISLDFFGNQLRRRQNETDDSLRERILLEMFRDRATRPALVAALEDLTGRRPLVFESARTSDTGGYTSTDGGGGGVAYNITGGWGNLSLPFQCFATVYRPVDDGIGQVAGWGGLTGGYGVGIIEYASLEMTQAQVTDNNIYSAITRVLPVSTICWTRITG